MRGAENKGATRMTIETLHVAIRAWLERKGFMKIEDLQELAPQGITLLHACLIVAQFVPRCPPEFRATGTSHNLGMQQQNRNTGPQTTVEQRKAILKLHERVSAKEPEENIDDSPGLVESSRAQENPASVPNLTDAMTGIEYEKVHSTEPDMSAESSQDQGFLIHDFHHEGHNAENSNDKDDDGDNDDEDNDDEIANPSKTSTLEALILTKLIKPLKSRTMSMNLKKK
jgi:hypothetical protein